MGDPPPPNLFITNFRETLQTGFTPEVYFWPNSICTAHLAPQHSKVSSTKASDIIVPAWKRDSMFVGDKQKNCFSLKMSHLTHLEWRRTCRWNCRHASIRLQRSRGNGGQGGCGEHLLASFYLITIHQNSAPMVSSTEFGQTGTSVNAWTGFRLVVGRVVTDCVAVNVRCT